MSINEWGVKEWLLAAGGTIIVLSVGLMGYGSYYKSVIAPERIKALEIKHQKEESEMERVQEYIRQSNLDKCIEGAERIYWDYVEVNMEKIENGNWWGANWKWDAAAEKKKAAEDKCFKQYK